MAVTSSSAHRLRNSGIELRHLYALHTLASEGHFGRAAAKLGITQPLLSMRIRGLETLLGETLFERRPRVKLTAAGEAFHRYALQAVRALEEGAGAAASAARGMTGQFSICFPTWMIASPVPEAINRFKKEHPQVSVMLRSIRSADQIDEVRQERVHVGFLRDPELGDEFEMEHLFFDPWMLAVPATDPRAGQGAASLASIQGDLLMIPDRQALNIGPALLSMVASAGGVPGEVQEFAIWLSALGLVAVGAGVALVPASQCAFLEQGIAYLPLDNRAQSDVCAFWRRGSRDPLLMSFVTLLREQGRAAQASNRSRT